MTCARKTLVSLRDTPYYHVIARCVRRAWLWGFDEYAGRDYSHRKAWVLERLSQLSNVFAIDICAYAIMANHYHLVLHIDQKRTQLWSSQEVIGRWCALFEKPTLIDRWLQGECGEAEREIAEGVVELWRRRLCDVSWYMRCLNEHLARRANAEDQCTGRFWEGRFKSQALLDEAGLLTAMAYVDLNPIRAGIADLPQSAEFTSIKQRASSALEAHSNHRIGKLPRLLDFHDSSSSGTAIPFNFSDYVELVEWTGRKGESETQPVLIKRLNVSRESWCDVMQSNGSLFGRALGRIEHMQRYAQALHQSWIRGMRRAHRLFG